MSNIFNEYRCPDCNKLLFKGVLIGSEVEIKCKRCNEIKKLKGAEGDALMCYKPGCPNRVTLEKSLKESENEN